jgi:hypothetical protein
MPGRLGRASDDHDNGSSQEAAVHVLILAAPINPDNTPHGYNWTFAFPMLLFIVIGTVLYMLLFGRPHARVPARLISLPARSDALGPDAARATAVAGGLDTAAGGGSTESQLEPHGAHLVASGSTEPVDTTAPDDEPAAADGAPATGDGAQATGDAAAGDTESSE